MNRSISTFLTIQGIVAIMSAAILLFWPVKSALVISSLIGAWLIVDAGVAFAAWWRGRRGLTLAHAVFSAVAGLVILFMPGVLLSTLVFVLSGTAVLLGIGSIFLALTLRSLGSRSWWLGLLLGCAMILGGFSMLFFPGDTITAGVWVAAVLLAGYGILSLMLLRRFKHMQSATSGPWGP